ncbi:hypothetical protein L596_011880 [Steinernema carpocapsae]|uniref:Uncharacterized protein n=1 Tax=Steinernema carpocapsae TaxID=34508 RepID=A0A4U5NW16_STECR|nr:hypothetical protein L596_011880 [Steinernema carpocapsae]
MCFLILIPLAFALFLSQVCGQCQIRLGDECSNEEIYQWSYCQPPTGLPCYVSCCLTPFDYFSTFKFSV